MARGTAESVEATRVGLLDAAMRVLNTDGYAGLSTRRVAAEADAPMSQIRYHFGSKEGLVLALFDHMNAQLLERQSEMFTDHTLTLSGRWALACEYLDDDLASGFVSVLLQLTAAGWTNPAIGETVGSGLMGWLDLLASLAEEAAQHGVPVGPLTPQELAALVGGAFIGAESLLLLGLEDQGVPIRAALQRIGELIVNWERTALREGA